MTTDDDRTTFAGSQMLNDLKAELVGQSEMLSSNDSEGERKDNPNQFPQNLLESVYDHEEEGWFRGTFFIGGMKNETKNQNRGHRSGQIFSSTDNSNTSN